MPPTDNTTEPPRELRPRPARAEIDPAALEIVRRRGAEIMAVARRWAETPEDAEDAYQRGLEIMLTKAPSTDPEHLVPWLKTVVKREAWAIRRQRERHTPPAPDSVDLDEPGDTTAHDQAERFERLQLGAEAMRRLKPQEVRALVLKAEGLSYQEICEETGWTYTKVNRCLTEGRRSFHDRLAGIESGAECERLAPLVSALADGEARAEDMAALRPHLRTCLVCRARLRDYRAAPARVAALVPPIAGLPLLAALRDAWHASSAWLHERAASAAVRWHATVEAAAAHKFAAVTASTAVLAGGGAATVATMDPPPDRARKPPPVARRADPPRPRPIATPVRPVPELTPGGAPRAKRGTPKVRRQTQPAEATAPPPPRGEFNPSPETAPPPAPKRRAAEPFGEGGEFAP